MNKTRILLVDDEASITRTLGMYLEGTGEFEVRAENRGSQALMTARDFKPDLVVLDIVMPDADGAAIAAELADDSELHSVPIIFLTALVSEGELGGQGKFKGGHLFLAKPVEPDLLIQHIRERIGS